MKESNSQKTVSDLLSNPIVMGIGAIAFIPDIIPVAIGAFVGYIISKLKVKMSRTNIQDQLKQANETINNSEFVGDAVNAIVDNQETIVITAFRMLTTLFVGILTVLTAVVSIPFNMFNSDKKGF